MWFGQLWDLLDAAAAVPVAAVRVADPGQVRKTIPSGPISDVEVMPL